MGNESRGLRLAGTNYIFLNEGAYGSVFVDRQAGRVRKVLRRTSNLEQHCRRVLDSEIRALALASEDEELRGYIAAPITELPEVRILDRDGTDVSSEFYPDAGFEATYIQGTFYKIGVVNAGNWPALASSFRAAGIRHLTDLSVTLDEAGNVDKIVDIATEDFG